MENREGKVGLDWMDCELEVVVDGPVLRVVPAEQLPLVLDGPGRGSELCAPPSRRRLSSSLRQPG